tara:strand:+ start:2002 stop:3399 length:1398 start_codon:yes stop_codon:yes gene_type:complete
MIKELIKLANELDRRGLLKESNELDKIIIKIATNGDDGDDGDEPPIFQRYPLPAKPRPFLELVPERSELDEYRAEQIEFYTEELNLNLAEAGGLSEGDIFSSDDYRLWGIHNGIADAKERIAFYRQASVEALLADMIENKQLSKSLSPLFVSPEEAKINEEVRQSQMSHFDSMFEDGAKKFIIKYGPEKLQKMLVGSYGRSQFDTQLQLSDEHAIFSPPMADEFDLLTFIEQEDPDGFYEILKTFEIDIVVSFLLKISDIDINELDDVFINSIDISSPIKIQHVLSKPELNNSNSNGIAFGLKELLEELLEEKLDSTGSNMVKIGNFFDPFGLYERPSANGSLRIIEYSLEIQTADLTEDDKKKYVNFPEIIKAMGETGRILVEHDAVKEHIEPRENWHEVEMKFDDNKVNELIRNGTLILEIQPLNSYQKEEHMMSRFGKMYALSAASTSDPSKARTILRKKKD